MRLSPDQQYGRPDPSRVPELPYHRLARWGTHWGCKCGAIFLTVHSDDAAESSLSRHLREVREREDEIRKEGAPAWQ
jgi:hypothetical protein